MGRGNRKDIDSREVTEIDKDILIEYSDALARVKLLREQLQKKEDHLDRLRERGYVVADTVTKGKRGKKPLGTAVIIGYPVPESQKAARAYEKSYAILMDEEQELLELINQVEKYIAGVDKMEIRNIMTLYYVEGLNWVQVAHRMNDLYKDQIYRGKMRCYTDSSCRQKHDRFLEKD
ncbi:hypothetical protein [Lacrimispora indolis]|uniref:hypothetical protein n=1 Tax=Lacrimispora indolis TaxID=69825 RepID=UPI0012EB1AF6|nr:hypothetical protein [Lacrimispora indolis]MBE7718804.1 hypothetical protein [Lacrimispora celerecrescens]